MNAFHLSAIPRWWMEKDTFPLQRSLSGMQKKKPVYSAAISTIPRHAGLPMRNRRWNTQKQNAPLRIRTPRYTAKPYVAGFILYRQYPGRLPGSLYGQQRDYKVNCVWRMKILQAMAVSSALPTRRADKEAVKITDLAGD